MKTCNSTGKNMTTAVASKIFLYQVMKVISQTLFTFHNYYDVAPFLVGEHVEAGEQPAEAGEEAEVRVQLVPLLLIGYNCVLMFYIC